MDEKLFKLIEITFLGGALVVVIYLGGFFGPVESLIVPLTSQAPGNSPSQQTAQAEFESKSATTRATQATPSLGDLIVNTPRPPTATPAGPGQAVTPNATLREYQIVSGDTCLGIAAKFNVTLDSLIALNGLDAECRILAGGTLMIPPPSTAVP